MDPLVEEYLRKKQGLDQGVSDAQSNADWMDAAAGIGNQVAAGFAPRNTVIYQKGWNETGAPKVDDTTFANKPADFSGLKSIGQRDLQNAQEARNQGVSDFDTQQKLQDLSTNRTQSAKKFENEQTKFATDQATAALQQQETKQNLAKGSREARNDAAMDDGQSPLATSLRNVLSQMDPKTDYSKATPRQMIQIQPALRDLTGYKEVQDKISSKSANNLKPTPAETLTKLANFDAARNTINRVSKDWDKNASGLGSSITSNFPGFDANLYNKSLPVSVQSVATGLEQGKLSDSDVPRYRKMFPEDSDTASQKKTKIDTLLQYVNDKQAAEVAALTAGGYKVPEPVKLPPEAPTPPPGGRVLRNRTTGEFKVLDAQGNEVKQ